METYKLSGLPVNAELGIQVRVHNNRYLGPPSNKLVVRTTYRHHVGKFVVIYNMIYKWLILPSHLHV